MIFRIHHACGFALALALVLFAIASVSAMAQGYEGYPYSIMTPEPGTTNRHRAARSTRTRHVKTPARPVTPLAEHLGHKRFYATRGSSGLVLPTQLPRNTLIPPEGSGVSVIHASPQEQGRTVLPGGGSVPNLPHGTETFQDRASRCAFQAGLYGVPNGTGPQQYIGACVQ